MSNELKEFLGLSDDEVTQEQSSSNETSTTWLTMTLVPRGLTKIRDFCVVPKSVGERLRKKYECGTLEEIYKFWDKSVPADIEKSNGYLARVDFLDEQWNVVNGLPKYVPVGLIERYVENDEFDLLMDKRHFCVTVKQQPDQHGYKFTFEEALQAMKRGAETCELYIRPKHI